MKTKPFATLADMVNADPLRRECIEIAKRAICDGSALVSVRARTS